MRSGSFHHEAVVKRLQKLDGGHLLTTSCEGDDHRGGELWLSWQWCGNRSDDAAFAIFDSSPDFRRGVAGGCNRDERQKRESYVSLQLGD